MHMDHRLTPRLGLQQLVERPRGLPVMDAPQGGGSLVRVREKLGLVEAVNLNSCRRERRINRPNRCENDRLMPPRLQRDGGIKRDLGLPAIHISPIENENDTHERPGPRCNAACRTAIDVISA